MFLQQQQQQQKACTLTTKNSICQALKVHNAYMVCRMKAHCFNRKYAIEDCEIYVYVCIGV